MLQQHTKCAPSSTKKDCSERDDNLLVQRQGEAAYNKEGKDATANNRALALAEEWQEFKDGVTFQPLRPEEERNSASIDKAHISSAGLAMQDSSKAGSLDVKKAALVCGAVAAAALSAVALRSRRT